MGFYSRITDKMAWGEYPIEYNPKVHGPYDPSRFYGKADTALAEVKLAELPAWLKRRNVSVSGVSGGISRGFWRWQHKYMQPKKVGIAPFAQVCVGAMIFFYSINYTKLSNLFTFDNGSIFSNADFIVFCRAPRQLQIPLVNNSFRSTGSMKVDV